jgi:hypothetical protein
MLEYWVVVHIYCFDHSLKHWTLSPLSISGWIAPHTQQEWARSIRANHRLGPVWLSRGHWSCIDRSCKPVHLDCDHQYNFHLRRIRMWANLSCRRQQLLHMQLIAANNLCHSLMADTQPWCIQQSTLNQCTEYNSMFRIWQPGTSWWGETIGST